MISALRVVSPIMVKKLFVMVLLLSLFSCNKTKPNVKKEDEKYVIVSHAGAGDPFWNIVFNGAKQAAADIDVNLQILAPETPNDLARQVELFNAAIAAKPKAIAVSIPDDQAFSQSLREAKQQGIAVVAFNTQPNDAARKNNPYLAFIGMDDYLSGQRIAQKTLGTQKVKDRVMIAVHQAGHVGLEQRALGIKEVLNPLNIVVDKLDISSDAAQAKQIVQGYLSKHKDCSAVYFVGAFGLHALGRWLNQDHPNILITSFDLTPLTNELIKEGKVAWSVDQQPFMQGYQSIVQLSLFSRYALQPSDINTGVALIDGKRAKNLDQLVSMGVR